MRKKILNFLSGFKKNKIFDIFAICLISFIFLCFIGYIWTKLAPELDHLSFSKDIEMKIFWVHPDWSAKSGGTGVLVQAPSGKTYLLTNAHICDISKNGMVYVRNAHYKLHERRILSSSLWSDLCLIDWQGPEKGFSLNPVFKKHEPVFVVGHPWLKDLTLTVGHVSSDAVWVELIAFVLNNENRKLCTKPKHFIKKIDNLIWFLFFGDAEACMERIKAIYTTAPIKPGSSGSPVFNAKYQIIGLIFAGNGDESVMIPTTDILDFLKGF